MSLPARIREAGGWVTVVRADLTEPKQYGTWDPVTRTITVHQALPERFAWETFYHELFHARLADSGIAAFLEDDAKVIEALCDMSASGRLREWDHDWEQGE